MGKSGTILNCPHCKHDVHLEDNFLGHEVACPSCEGKVEIASNPQMRPEKTIYTDDKIKVTTKRIIVEGHSYLLKYISMVWRQRENPTNTVSLWLLIAGVLALIGGIVVVAVFNIDGGWNLISVGGLMSALAAIAVLKPTHFLMVTLDGGEVKLYGDKDRAYVIRLVGKMKKALALSK